MTDPIKKLESEFRDLPKIRDNLAALNSSLDKIKDALIVIEECERRRMEPSDSD